MNEDYFERPIPRAAQFSIAWLLLNWWVHDSLHIHVGMALNGLLGMEYGFHITLMIAGIILATFFMTLLHKEKTESDASQAQAG